MLTSTQNRRVKQARLLQNQRDERDREGLFVAEGVRLSDDLIKAGLTAEYAFISAQATAARWQAEHRTIDTLTVSDTVMRSLSLEMHPPGVLVVFRTPAVNIDELRASPPHQILILDALRDPGNLGACLRVAAGADCRLVLLSPGSVDPFNPKALRGGMGAHARLTVAALDWLAIRSICKGRPVWVAEAAGERTYDLVSWNEPNALVIGGEANGISATARELLSGAISIPLANRVESLNAAVACGVVLFEAARQRRHAAGRSLNERTR